MEKTEFKSIVQNCLSEYDFIYTHKNYYFNNESLIIVINLQKSNFENSFFINCGFFVKEIHQKGLFPDIKDCDIFGRFFIKTGDTIKYEYYL